LVDKRIFVLKISYLLVFIFLLAVGFNLARNKPLWGDEIFSQVMTIEQGDYWDFLKGPSSGERNNAPLFFVIQKMVCQLAGYQTPIQWLEGKGDYDDFDSRVVLRVQPVVLMSLAMVLIFYYFTRYGSWLAGFYSLLLALSSYMVWLYWAEARHYALWFFLTTIQTLLFLRCVESENISKSTWRGMAAAHILIAFSVNPGLAQIMIVSFLLWIFRERDIKKYIWLTGVPVMIGLYYLFKSMMGGYVSFYADEGIKDYIIPCFPLERIAVAGMGGVLLLWRVFSSRRSVAVPFKSFNSDAFFRMTTVLTFAGLMFLEAVVIFILIKLHPKPPEGGALLSIRYFIFLTPVSIIATVVFVSSIFKVLGRSLWMKMNLIIFFGGLLIFEFLRNACWVIGIY
jgi:hypothetical protein